MEIKINLETKVISDNIVQTTYMSPNEETVHLTINYMNGKYIIDKAFQNNYWGKKELEKVMKNFDTEEKVKKHFKL